MTPEREAEIRQHLATLGVFFTPTDLMIRELLAEIDHLRANVQAEQEIAMAMQFDVHQLQLKLAELEIA